MEGKLIKQEKEYYALYNNEGVFISDINGGSLANRLSLKNCQAIENGYNLDELTENYFNNYYAWIKGETSPYSVKDKNLILTDFKAGFQKAVEIFGDKMFDEEDILIAIEAGYHSGINHNVDEEESSDKIIRLKNSVIPSLQQTEWDVQIEMVFKHIPKNNGIHNAHTIESVPKLDADGCLILKRK